MKANFAFLLLLYCLIVSFKSIAKEVKHFHAHSRVGMHGMVLFTDGVELYASHLPLYHAPHDYQLIYRVETRYEKELIRWLTVQESDSIPQYLNSMITLLPAKFDLNKLIAGQTFSVPSQLFFGHFERGGKKWLKDENFKFVSLVYKRALSSTQHVSQPRWQRINKATNEQGIQILVHQIQASPSFDAIVLVRGCETERLQVEVNVPTFTQLSNSFQDCEYSQIAYFETQDFIK